MASQSSGRRKRKAATTNETRQQQSGSRRFRGLTCSNCRTRKVRCDGVQPACKMCELYSDDCQYDKPPPMSQLIAMASRLQEAEQTIAELQSRQVNGLIVNTTPFSDGVPAASPHSYRASAVSNIISSQASITTGGVWIESSGNAPDDCRTSNRDIDTELTVDEHGNARYYGPTSAVREPSLLQGSATSGAMRQTLALNTSDTLNSLAAHARETAIWEEFAYGNVSLATAIPRQTVAKLLHIHFAWVGPMFLWVHRPSFIHDMATNGRHYSEFLLLVLCAHSAKYLQDSSADMLLARARALIGTAVQQSSSIPTIQALLQLSASELAQGSISQTWVYSGLAFRMASDLGLQYSDAVKGLNPVDLEVRRRLYWSCYFWDKATSLYTGRMPSINEVMDVTSLNKLDMASDADAWVPHFGESVNLCKLSHAQYHATSNYVVTCFINSCKLSIIINDIITQIYHRKGQSVIETSFRDIKARLDLWRSQSPTTLRYEPEMLPSTCPPPHIISQNLLYFASVILTHRPFWSIPKHYRVCTEAARSIERLVLLFESTFDLANITYLMGYCIYTGASVILEDAKKDKESAHAILHTFLRALNTAMRRCRLLERSLNIIIKEMGRSQPMQTSITDETIQGGSSIGMSGYIPAFPFVDRTAATDFDMNAYFSQADSGLTQSLDSYPEMQMDFGSIFGNLNDST